jgi:hypothetical protein
MQVAVVAPVEELRVLVVLAAGVKEPLQMEQEQYLELPIEAAVVAVLMEL